MKTQPARYYGSTVLFADIVAEGSTNPPVWDAMIYKGVEGEIIEDLKFETSSPEDEIPANMVVFRPNFYHVAIAVPKREVVVFDYKGDALVGYFAGKDY